MSIAAINNKGKQTPLSLDKSESLGSGAVAEVYRAGQPFPELAAKIYYDPSNFNRKKIEAMLAAPPDSLIASIDARNYAQYAWPTHLLLDNKKLAIGYLMPLIPKHESTTMEVFINPVLRQRAGLKALDAISLRLEIARNLSALLVDLHKKGHHFIDFKPQNICVYRNSHLVTLLDCDGYSINSQSSPSFPATHYSSEYIAPEALSNHMRPEDMGIEQDRYVLAVLIFQIMNNGIHPFQGVMSPGTDVSELNTTDKKVKKWLYPYGKAAHPRIQPLASSIHGCIDGISRNYFDRAFSGAPGKRPTTIEWFHHLSRLLDSKQHQLARCKNEPNNPAHIHFLGKPCMACQLEGVAAKALQTGKNTARPAKKRKPNRTAVQSSFNNERCPACDSFDQKKRSFGLWMLNGPATVLSLDLVVCNQCEKLYSHSLGRVKPLVLWILRTINVAFMMLVLFIIIAIVEVS